MSKGSDAAERHAVHDSAPACRAATVDGAPDDAPEGYKRTEVGVIPEKWRVRSLDSIGGDPAVKAGPFGSSLTKSSYSQTGFKVYGQEQVLRGDHLFGDYFISKEKYRQLRSCSVKPGDVLISLVGTAGKALLIPEDAVAGIINPRLVRVRLNEAQIEPRFFKYLIESEQIQTALSRDAQGGTMDVLNAGILRALHLPIPPFLEQRAIATALSDADALIESLDRLIAKKRAIKQAAMQQLLTGQSRLPGFSGPWEKKRLGDYVTFLKTGTNSRSELSGRGSVAYLHYGDIHVGAGVRLDPDSVDMPRIDRSKVRRLDYLQRGDLVFVDASEDLEGVGKCVEVAHVPPNGMVAGLHTIAARFNKAVLEDGFKAYLQFCPDFIQPLRRLAAGTKVLATNRQHIASIEMALPEPSEQKAIASMLSDIDAEIEALERWRDKAHQVKKGMMQQLLTGRVRLPLDEYEDVA